MNVKDNVSRTAGSALVRRPSYFTNMYGKMFTASCSVENQLQMRLPEDDADGRQNAYNVI
jgi:hypothetical protein